VHLCCRNGVEWLIWKMELGAGAVGNAERGINRQGLLFAYLALFLVLQVMSQHYPERLGYVAYSASATVNSILSPLSYQTR